MTEVTLRSPIRGLPLPGRAGAATAVNRRSDRVRDGQALEIRCVRDAGGAGSTCGQTIESAASGRETADRWNVAYKGRARGLQRTCLGPTVVPGALAETSLRAPGTGLATP